MCAHIAYNTCSVVELIPDTLNYSAQRVVTLFFHQTKVLQKTIKSIDIQHPQ